MTRRKEEQQRTKQRNTTADVRGSHRYKYRDRSPHTPPRIYGSNKQRPLSLEMRTHSVLGVSTPHAIGTNQGAGGKNTNETRNKKSSKRRQRNTRQSGSQARERNTRTHINTRGSNQHGEATPPPPPREASSNPLVCRSISKTSPALVVFGRAVLKSGTPPSGGATFQTV